MTDPQGHQDPRDVCNFQHAGTKRCPNPPEIIIRGQGCCDLHSRHRCWATDEDRKKPKTFNEWIIAFTHKSFKRNIQPPYQTRP